jgi:hypothetical protein
MPESLANWQIGYSIPDPDPQIEDADRDPGSMPPEHNNEPRTKPRHGSGLTFEPRNINPATRNQ